MSDFIIKDYEDHAREEARKSVRKIFWEIHKLLPPQVKVEKHTDSEVFLSTDEWGTRYRVTLETWSPQHGKEQGND